MLDFNVLLPSLFLNFLLAPIILAVILTLGFFVVRRVLRQGANLPYAFSKIILRVGLPKEVNLEDAKKEITKEQMLEKISQAEEMFAGIGGLRAESGFNSFLFGRQDHLSFEIVALDGKIDFFVAVPQYLARYLGQQIHAQYPHAQIDQMEDYYIFRLKTFRKMGSDPLDAVTNSLSKLGDGDGAAIQIIVRSAKSSWRQVGLKVVKEMQKGKTMNQAVKSVGAVSMLGRVGSSFFNVAKDFAIAGTSGKTKEQKERGQQNKCLTVPHKLSAMEEETAKGIEEKAAKAGLDVNIRIIVSAGDQALAASYLSDIANSFTQYNIYEYGNKFSIARPRSPDKLIRDFIYRHFDAKKKLVLNNEEMAVNKVARSEEHTSELQSQ